MRVRMLRGGLAMGALAALLAVGAALPVAAQERNLLGFGRIFNNDALGDQGDRWRTGSYSLSAISGRGWDGALPDQPGALLEYRFRGEIIAAENLARPAAGDRRYVGALSLGVHTHFARAGFEARLGVDIVATGPATGLGALQRRVHKAFGLPRPALGNQIGNGLHPTVSGELGRPFALGQGARLRPFVEAQAGAETLVRAGADLTIGGFGTGTVLVRDVITGQHYSAIRSDGQGGFSLTMGGDVAHVGRSIYLPAGGPAPAKTRTRLRAGLHWQGERAEMFYGLTRLGREYVGQREGQTLGSLSLRIRF